MQGFRRAHANYNTHWAEDQEMAVARHYIYPEPPCPLCRDRQQHMGDCGVCDDARERPEVYADLCDQTRAAWDEHYPCYKDPPTTWTLNAMAFGPPHHTDTEDPFTRTTRWFNKTHRRKMRPITPIMLFYHFAGYALHRNAYSDLFDDLFAHWATPETACVVCAREREQYWERRAQMRDGFTVIRGDERHDGRRV